MSSCGPYYIDKWGFAHCGCPTCEKYLPSGVRPTTPDDDTRLESYRKPWADLNHRRFLKLTRPNGPE